MKRAIAFKSAIFTAAHIHIESSELTIQCDAFDINGTVIAIRLAHEIIVLCVCGLCLLAFVRKYYNIILNFIAISVVIYLYLIDEQLC